tara:strand:+ start:733 stop:1113 length:381 start_codon:yes stop_codon:yes gene_type:complete
LESTQELEQAIQSSTSLLIGEYGWMFLAGLLVLFFKTSIESLLSGLLVFVGNDYNNDDIILLDGRPGRIVRVTLWKTTFFLYNVKVNKDGEKYIVSGTKVVIQNAELKNLRIEKPLPNFELDTLLD